MDYIFGYGSLICADSRSRTGVTGSALPIEIKGIARRWSVHSPEWNATAVGAHLSPESLCNGVYFPVDGDNLARFDQREMGYQRINIEWSSVTALTDVPLPTQGTLWAYVGDNHGEPTSERPITQSYLDVILNGCFDYGLDFAAKFTELTQQWQHLVNDRHQPLYPRPLQSTERIHHIDQFVQKHLPTLWKQRKTLRHH